MSQKRRENFWCGKLCVCVQGRVELKQQMRELIISKTKVQTVQTGKISLSVKKMTYKPLLYLTPQEEKCNSIHLQCNSKRNLRLLGLGNLASTATATVSVIYSNVMN